MAGFTFPMSFKTQEISTNSVTIHTRVGGAGRAVMLLHGYGETGDMWVPLAVDLTRDHTVIVPDLRGLGRSVSPSPHSPWLAARVACPLWLQGRELESRDGIKRAPRQAIISRGPSLHGDPTRR